MSARVKQGWAAAGYLIVVAGFFFGDMIFRGRGFFYGDYRMQYYPWALELSRSLKHFTLPFWSDKMGCGFPLLAEGQIGALHPLKWILYGLLPIEWGYPIGFWLLFLAAGWFGYALLRRLGGSWEAGIVTAMIFCYGSAYAGLAWGNASLWVLAWLPWATDRAEALCQKPGHSRAGKLALITSLMWLGGVPQLALYGTLFVLGYIFVRRRAGWWGLAAAGLAAAVAAAQLLPTLELVSLSARSQTGLDFALQKSLNPVNLAALVQPGLGFFGADIYVGILPLVLIGLALGSIKRVSAVRAFAILAVAAFAIALGKWNPVYVAFIKSLHIYSFRSPSKWILFALFAMAVLAGLGWDVWWDKNTRSRSKLRSGITVLVMSLGVWLAAYTAATLFAPAIRQWAEHYVLTEVYGKGGHPHSLQSYLERIPGYLQLLSDRISLSDYYFKCTAAAVAAAVGWFYLDRWNLSKPAIKTAGLFLIAADLFLFSFVGSGFRGNRTDARVVAPDAITQYLAAEPGLFRAYEFTPDPMNAPRWPSNSNLIPNYASIGLYTPLAPAAYIEKTDRLGAVDDSTGTHAASEQVPLEEQPLLNRMNVRFMLTRGELPVLGSWREVVRSADGSVLYQDPGAWPRAYEVPGSGLAPSSKTVKVIEARAGFYQLETHFIKKGVLAVSENGLISARPLSSGWHATVDGRPVRVQPFEGCFISVPVDAGRHQVVLKYIPTMFWAGLAVSAAALLAIGVLIKR